MIKFKQCEHNITPFGGINFCRSVLADSGIPALIDEHLGQRSEQGYLYSDIFTGYLSVFLCGGDCAEDIQGNLGDDLRLQPHQEICSADTLLRGVKELAVQTTQIESKTGAEHGFNSNQRLNQLLVKGLRTTGQLSPGRAYTLDYDNKVLPTEKWDARRAYTGEQAYQPGVATIAGDVVGVEGRGGNSPASYRQKQTLQGTFNSLEAEDIVVRRFRADAASYQREVVEEVCERDCLFYIRAKRSRKMGERIAELPDSAWTPVRLEGQRMEVAELAKWQPFGEEIPYRLVVSRIKRRSEQKELFDEDAYTWRAILTNDTKWSAEQVVRFYNQRGAAERVFDELGNDFGWKRLPCSFLDENTAFMIMTAIFRNLYRFLLGCFSEKLDWLEPTFRLKKFIFRFISVAGKWISSGGQSVLNLYTSKNYRPLRC